MQTKTFTPVNFAEHLACLIESRGLTQKKFAQDIGSSEASVVKWLKGSVPLGPNLNRIAEYFGLHPDYLLNPSKYSQGIQQAVIEAEAMKGTKAEKEAFFNRRVAAEAEKLKVRQTGWEDAMKLNSESNWQERAEIAELKVARLKKMLQEALAEL